MKKLYSHFVSLSFIVLCSAGVIQSMDIVPQPQVTSVQSVVPSLKQLCLDCIGQNAQHENINLISKDILTGLSADLASEAIAALDSKNVEENKIKLIELAQSNELDREVSCAIAEKIKDVALAYELAKSGPITDGVASLIIDNFLDLDITTCLNDFDSTFNKMFPQEILEHGNDFCLHRVLMNKITNQFITTDWTINDTTFSTQDFEQNLSIEKIANHVANKYFINESFKNACANGYVTLSSCGQFLAFIEPHPISKAYHILEIHNLKTRIKVKVINNLGLGDNSINKIAFSQNGLNFGILSKDGNIHSFEFASMLFNNNISFQQLSCLVYCYEQLLKKVSLSNFLCELFAENIEEEKRLNDAKEELIRFIYYALDYMEFLPITRSISKQIEFYLKSLEQQCDMIYILNFIASEKLHMTKKEILTKWFIDRDQEFINNLFAIIGDNFDDAMQIDFQAALNQHGGYIYAVLSQSIKFDHLYRF